MMLPSSRDWIFSLKTFCASMVALYIALRLELPRPYWAMASVYIVSNPFVGATTSKAMYRTLGTLLGAAASIALVPPLVEAPYLLSLAVALWVGIMLYLAIADRTARSYTFMLAAYTLPLIAFPTVSNPATVFDVAVSRAEEIVLGIVCASIVNTVILPSKLAPVLAERTAAWFRDAAFYAAETLAGRPGGNEMSACSQRMAATINGLEVLLSQLSYDHTRPEVVRQARELRGRMSLLMPVISSLADPLHAFRGSQAPAQKVMTGIVDKISEWIELTRRYPGEHTDHDVKQSAEQLRAELGQLEPTPEALRAWEGALFSSMLWRLRLLIDLWQDCVTLQHMIAEDKVAWWTPQFCHWRLGGVERFLDRGIMLFSTVTAAGAVLLACALWIESGWQDGAAAASVAAIGVCFFAALDDPAPQLFRTFIAAALSVVVAGLYLFVILPNAHDFAMLVIWFAVPFICVGTLIPQPRFALMAVLTAVNTANFISLQSAYDANFQTYINSNLAAVIGVLFAYLWTRVTRPFGAELAARRLIRSSWQDLVAAASPHPLEEQRNMAARMLDRLIQLLPRLASTDTPQHPSIDSFRDMRAGLNALDLQVEREKVQPPLRAAIDRVLAGVQQHFLNCIEHDRREEPPAALLGAIDTALGDTVSVSTADTALDLMYALVALRLSVFPNRPPPLLSNSALQS
ncbi:fusaric acid resistance protein [Paraburkholderia phytofirmans OLGA172]|uniref:Fusaric acid resistance protein n=1 Tax=Paraburkholderia phytofirmans OLGA172 TaxID=1417228 RepID=A0A160FJR9_9BURK|nr:FUSC family protein [Paraburkholderia phytofirmans]ANB72216.1 fusaric acid resistance protein [Paraburkholderia phytofirmans OLGA172]